MSDVNCMPSVKDQLNRIINIASPPQRIISLVPSQTELLFFLGLGEKIVGITKFCVHPHEQFRSKQKVGGTKQLDIEKIHQLQPDLIIANKEENLKEQIDTLSASFPVWISDVNNLNNAYEMINTIGCITETSAAAADLINEIKTRFSSLLYANKKPRTAYLIWQKPYMTVGGDTFIHSMLCVAGFENIFSNETRYPVVTIERLQQLQCEVLLLSSEPFPFTQKHIIEIQSFLPNTKILLVDGEMFSWYGSRMLHAPGYFNSLHK